MPAARLRLATVDNLLLYTMSATPDKTIQALIDQAKAGGPTQIASEVQTAMALLPEAKTAEFFATYNYLRVLQLVTAMMPLPIPKTDVPTQSNIALTGEVGDAKLQFNAAIPKQHVEIVTREDSEMTNNGRHHGTPPQLQPPAVSRGRPGRIAVTIDRPGDRPPAHLDAVLL
jgi:RecG-like helicase